MKAGQIGLAARERGDGIGAVAVAQVDRQSGLGRLAFKKAATAKPWLASRRIV
jgi:hypothetical protein